ncbi:uncharacterized protein LOC133174626 [Saccostrea echinata]|uniref:uncharacterized protein LOC133174626 n=1 Tax=Saccostrea echinata TaxID=191078 RepID=UPI002A807E11|nr:uncharacterized protein LOC133174626 [Saccostrea echinata]
MTSLETIQTSISELKSSSSKFDTDVKKIRNDFGQLETNVSALGNVFDSVKETADKNKKTVDYVKKNLDEYTVTQKTLEEKLTSDVQALKEAKERLEESVTDLKARSMRDNLVFSGIPEDQDEDTEAVIQNLMRRRFRLDYDIPFERVHRMGRANEFSEWPRNIVAKFTYYKDREYIRQNAARRLHGTNV